MTLAQMYFKAPWLVWIGWISGVVWLILWFVGYKKKKRVMSSYDAQRVLPAVDDLEQSIYYELGVPDDAKTADILLFDYKVKNGIVKVCTIGDNLAPYHNIEFRVFISDRKLCLVDKENRYEIEMSSFVAIRTVKSRINITDWNKNEEYNKGEYKQYKIKKDENIDTYYIRSYHILEFDVNGETWGIYFPNYEKEAFEDLTGLSAENI